MLAPRAMAKPLAQLVLVRLQVALCQHVTTPEPPYAKGATLRLKTQCKWQSDESAEHVIGLGLAEGPGSPPQASIEACEKWCCETSHMKYVKGT